MEERVEWDGRCSAILTAIRRLGPVLPGRVLSSSAFVRLAGPINFLLISHVGQISFSMTLSAEVRPIPAAEGKRYYSIP